MELLIVHPIPDVLEEIASTFSYDGEEIHRSGTLSHAIEILATKTIDFCLVANHIPDGSVLEFHSALEEAGHIPSILLAYQPSQKDIVLALEYGFDDVMRMPVSMMELKARIRAILRRNPETAGTPLSGLKRTYHDLSVDLMRRQACNEIGCVTFTNTEFELFLLLLYAEGTVLSREEIVAHLWGDSVKLEHRSLDVYIRRIRKKLKTIDLDGRIVTKWGKGYAFLMQPGQKPKGLRRKIRSDFQRLDRKEEAE